MFKALRYYGMVLLVMAFLVTGCSREGASQTIENQGEKKIQIIATLFPQYDFAKHIVGDKGEVSLLIPPGVGTHSFEPTPADLIKISKADLFVYTGANMETWAEKIISGTDMKRVKVLDVSENIPLENPLEDDHDDYDDQDDYDDYDDHDAHDNHHHEGHVHAKDPHIWTNPQYAKIMVEHILSVVCELDPQNTNYYEVNAKAYLEELDNLDKTFKEIVAKGKRKEIVFGTPFSFYYFTKQYGLDYEAAYDSCSDQAEPSAKRITELIEEIREDQIPVIYYGELTEPKVARSISQETGAKMLLLHSAHNVTAEEFKAGTSYIDIMKQNAENLKEGLN